MSILVRVAARSLPAAVRERYREQWLADVRDASEAGMRPSQIGFAALAFALTYDRSLPPRPARAPEQRAQRTRLAVGLALSSALLALTVYPRVSFQGLTGLVVWDYARFFIGTLALAYVVLAPLLALVLVRGSRQRWAVVLLVLACTAPLMLSVIDGALPWQWSANIYMTPGSSAFIVAGLLILWACGLLWKTSSATTLRAPLVGGLAVWLVAGLGLAYGNSVAWSDSVPIAVAEQDPAFWAEWQAMTEQHHEIVTGAFWGWAIAAALLGIVVFLIGRRMSEPGAVALGVAAVAISLLGASGVFGLLELGIADSVLPVLLDPMRFVAQLILVAVTLFSVSGMRLTRLRHRHDVEGSVELVKR